ncbi:MAG: hypothetical protein P4L99_27445 [Chthoniobacter sp.]|nr:hypothetical protein [Chthoniobacter sp.]
MFGDTVTAELVGGSRDGGVFMVKDAPEFLKWKLENGWAEIYERQNEEPPFVYVQIGYAEEEQWS